MLAPAHGLQERQTAFEFRRGHSHEPTRRGATHTNAIGGLDGPPSFHRLSGSLRQVEEYSIGNFRGRYGNRRILISRGMLFVVSLDYTLLFRGRSRERG